MQCYQYDNLTQSYKQGKAWAWAVVAWYRTAKINSWI